MEVYLYLEAGRWKDAQISTRLELGPQQGKITNVHFTKWKKPD